MQGCRGPALVFGQIRTIVPNPMANCHLGVLSKACSRTPLPLEIAPKSLEDAAVAPHQLGAGKKERTQPHFAQLRLRADPFDAKPLEAFRLTSVPAHLQIMILRSYGCLERVVRCLPGVAVNGSPHELSAASRCLFQTVLHRLAHVTHNLLQCTLMLPGNPYVTFSSVHTVWGTKYFQMAMYGFLSTCR